MKRTAAHYRFYLQRLRRRSYTMAAAAANVGLSEDEARQILRGETPPCCRIPDYELAATRGPIAVWGRRLLREPDVQSLDGVFEGNVESYRQCVVANFGEEVIE